MKRTLLKSGVLGRIGTLCLLTVVVSALCMSALPSYAQSDAEIDPIRDSSLLKGISEKAKRTKQPYVRPAMDSLFFNPWQMGMLMEARRGLTARLPDESELKDDGEKVVHAIRELSLGGIVYASADDWTIWFNQQRVTPDAVPPEIIDIKVFDEYVELKWFDKQTNVIFPVRLRAHQKFNLDYRLFSPG